MLSSPAVTERDPYLGHPERILLRAPYFCDCSKKMKHVQSSASMKSCHYGAPVGESSKTGMCFYCFSLLHVLILTSATKLPGRPNNLHIQRSKSNKCISVHTQRTLSNEALGVCPLSSCYPVLNNTPIQCLILNVQHFKNYIALRSSLIHRMPVRSSFSNHRPGPKPG